MRNNTYFSKTQILAQRSRLTDYLLSVGIMAVFGIGILLLIYFLILPGPVVYAKLIVHCLSLTVLTVINALLFKIERKNVSGFSIPNYLFLALVVAGALLVLEIFMKHRNVQTDQMRILLERSLLFSYILFFFIILGILVIFRAFFLLLLRLIGNIDLEAIVSRRLLYDKLNIYWYASIRKADKFCLVLVLLHLEGTSTRRQEMFLGYKLKKCLAIIYDIITASIRKSDQMGVFSHRTFWTILSHTDATGAEVSIRRIMEKIKNHPHFQSLSKKCKPVLTSGMAQYLLTMEQCDEIIHNAHSALQKAKASNEPIVVNSGNATIL